MKTNPIIFQNWFWLIRNFNQALANWKCQISFHKTSLFSKTVDNKWNTKYITTSFSFPSWMWPSQWYLAFHLVYWLTEWPILSLRSVDCNSRTSGSKFGTNCTICRLLISCICWVIDLMGEHLGRTARSCWRGKTQDGCDSNSTQSWIQAGIDGWGKGRLIYDIVRIL